jgi:hypothetical protein
LAFRNWRVLIIPYLLIFANLEKQAVGTSLLSLSILVDLAVMLLGGMELNYKFYCNFSNNNSRFIYRDKLSKK